MIGGDGNQELCPNSPNNDEKCISVKTEASTDRGTKVMQEHNDRLRLCCTHGFVVRPKEKSFPVKSENIVCAKKEAGATFLMSDGQKATMSTCEIGSYIYTVFMR